MTASEIERQFTIKQLQAYNSEIRSKYNHLNFLYSNLTKKFDKKVEIEVKNRTRELENDYNNQLKEKDKQIEA